MASRDLSQRNRELTLLTHISQALNRTTEIDSALQLILNESAEYFSLETGWIWLLHPQNDEHFLAAAVNLPPALSEKPERMLGWCWCIETYRDGDMDSAELVRTIHCTRLRDLIDGTNGLNFHATIPLTAGDTRLGLLNLASAERRDISDEELALLHTIGDMLAIAVERNRLFEQSRTLGVIAERNRLARELHDTLAQSLAGIALQLESAELTLDANPQKTGRFITKALNQTRTTLTEARRSVLDLRASPLENQTLCDALRQHIATLPIKVTVDFVDEYRPMPANIAMGLYRIACEALNNTIEHAQVDSATLRLVHLPQHIELTIRDSGIGFSFDDVPASRFGLIGMAERAKLLGGHMTLDASPGVGTSITVTIPL